MNRNRFLLTGVLLVCLGLLAGINAFAAPASQSLPANTYRGVLSALWIDYEDGRPTSPQFFLQTAVDQTYLLEPGQVSEAELTVLLRQEVVVTAIETAETQSATSGEAYPLLVVQQIWPQKMAETMGLAQTAAITGNTPWVSIGCKFPDRLAELRPMSYFAGMYSNDFPGLNHYWREVSNEHINLNNSAAFGWYVLPRPYASYFNAAGDFMLYLFRDDCLAVADADIYFPDYYGFNLIINGDGLSYAWGGTGTTIELDGVTRQWATTWMSNWSHPYISVFEHEMGHGYGLPHSYVNQGNDPYDNHWDVMSKDRFNCRPRYSDPVYGCYGQHTIAVNKDRLGWLEPDRVFVADQGTHTVTLERSALPGPTGYLLVKIPIAGSAIHYFTLEARQLVGYDDKLFGEAVVIHEIGGTPRLISLVAPTTIGDGSMWTTGEIYHYAEEGISVRVEAATHSGFVVTVRNGLSPQVTVLNPSDDTYIRKDAPDTNFGREPVLLAGPKEADGQINTLTLLKFDRALVPESMYRITLRLAVIDDAGVADPNYVAWTPPDFSSGEWTETELTWNNRNNLMFGWLAPERNGDWLEWDVTYYVNRYGSPTFAVAIGDAPRIATYSSKEGPNPSQLIVDYLVAPGSVTATPTAGPSPTVTRTPSPTPTFTPTPGLPPPVIEEIDNADGDGNFVVEWSPVAGIDGYRLREGIDGGDDSVIYAGTEPRLVRSNLPKGQYCYRVRAIIEGGEWGPYSAITCTAVSKVSSTPTSTPTPQGLAAPVLNDIPNADGDGNFVVSWTAVSGAEEYRLREGLNGAEDAVIHAGPERSVNRSNLANGEYCYRGRAIVVNGEWGPYSATKCVTVNKSDITPTVTPTLTPEPAFKIALPLVIGRRP